MRLPSYPINFIIIFHALR